MTTEQLRWKKYPVLNDGFICLIDGMGDDSSIVQAARVSYGKDEREQSVDWCTLCENSGYTITHNKVQYPGTSTLTPDGGGSIHECGCVNKISSKDRNLIRYLLAHGHTTPFEMVEFKFLVRVPMDCWRQWIRHRTANVNEYSTRYTEAIDSQQTTSPDQWRLQATDNKQGSSGFLEMTVGDVFPDPETVNGSKANFMIGHYSHEPMGKALSEEESAFHAHARMVYDARLQSGVAKEQARKDLPLSTYTEAYWKCDLHNIFNFLQLRMDSHAQYEIRMYANAMAEIVKQVVPVAWEAFEDYILHAKKFSRMEMEVLKAKFSRSGFTLEALFGPKPDSMTDREWKSFLEKLA